MPMTFHGASIRLRVDQFDLMTRVLGLVHDEARARAIGINSKSLYRARRGALGEGFIAATVAALRRREDELAELNLVPSMDALFEVVVVPDLNLDAGTGIRGLGR
jgi:hypothetical protein